MVSFVLLTAIAAAPVQVTVSRSVDVKAHEADAFLARLRTAISDAGVGEAELLSPAVREGCRGKQPCLRDAAGERAGHVLLDVELAWVAGQLGANLTAANVASGEPLASHAFIVGGERYHLALDAELTRFARMLREALPPRLPWAPSADARLLPGGLEAAPDAVSPERSPLARRVVLGSAGASGVAAGVLGILGLMARGQLEAGYVNDGNGTRRSLLDQQRAAALAETANARFTGAVVAAAFSAALATTALFILPGEPEPE